MTPEGNYMGEIGVLSCLIARFICVVTGAGTKKGMGRSTVFELAAHGVACVYACDIDDSNFDELIAECKEQYPSTEVSRR
jgi:NAD(P)-dependent dehydrogenase (short-subunit alcohol dehydrogenase family)